MFAKTGPPCLGPTFLSKVLLFISPEIYQGQSFLVVEIPAMPPFPFRDTQYIASMS